MRNAVICEAVRTPTGKFQGTLTPFEAPKLGAHVVKALLERSGIDAARIDEDELTAQALAAIDPEEPPRPTVPPAHASRWPLVIAVLAAFAFLGLWMEERQARAESTDPWWAYEPETDGLLQRFRPDGEPRARLFDRDHDGYFEETNFLHGAKGLTRVIDASRDGSYEQSITEQTDGVTIAWIDGDGDGWHEECTVTNAAGKVVQTLRWNGTDFTVEHR